MKCKCRFLRCFGMMAIFTAACCVWLPSVFAENLPGDYITLAKIVSADFITDEEEPEDIQGIFDKLMKEMASDMKTLRAMKPATDEFVKLRRDVLKMNENARKDFLAFKSTIPEILFEDEETQQRLGEEMSEEEQEAVLDEIVNIFVELIALTTKYVEEEKPVVDQLIAIVPKYSAARKRNEDTIQVQYHDVNEELIFIGFKANGPPLSIVFFDAKTKLA